MHIAQIALVVQGKCNPVSARVHYKKYKMTSYGQCVHVEDTLLTTFISCGTNKKPSTVIPTALFRDTRPVLNAFKVGSDTT